MNVFILTVDFDRESFIAALDRTPMVRNWLSFLSAAVAVASNRTGHELSEYLHAQLPSHSFLLNSAGTILSAGYLPPAVWNFINNPVDSGRHPPDQTPTNYLSALSRLAATPANPPPYVQTPPGSNLLTGLPTHFGPSPDDTPPYP